jgi:hypothetical protein
MQKSIAPRIKEVVYPFARSIKYKIYSAPSDSPGEIWRCTLRRIINTEIKFNRYQYELIIYVVISSGSCVSIQGCRENESFYSTSFQKDEFSEELLAIRLKECYMEICKHIY